MSLPDEIRQQFRAWGKQGGETRSRRMDPKRRSAQARGAALHRWNRARFGDHSFEHLGLPGGEIIDQGLADLAEEIDTPEALLVSLAAPRLRREGVSLPATVFDDPESRLYRSLAISSPGLAHARYLALLRQAASFADACRSRRAR
jgi:hypothetical protein